MGITNEISVHTISSSEMEMAEKSVEYALKAGASDVQVCLDKASTDLTALLNGELDNIRHTGDRALTIRIYADGRSGIFSTNRLETKSIESFIKAAVENVRFLAKDPHRKLPDQSETAHDAIRGDEMELCCKGYDNITEEDRLRILHEASIFGKECANGIAHSSGKLISEETEYNNTLTDTFLIDSAGTMCRHIETSFEVCVQSTVEDRNGNKYSGLWWEYNICPDKVRHSICGEMAMKEALMQINPVKLDGGEYTMVVDNRFSGKLIHPIIQALQGTSIQQNSSFLNNTLGSKVLGEGVTLLDRPRVKGKTGSILFEGDGRACLDRDILRDGVVMEYFIGTYMSSKLGMPATSETANRPVLQPFVKGDKNLTEKLRSDSELITSTDSLSLGKHEILSLCGDGIFVTGFNGGNCNTATGDFSYGVEGFRFRNGQIEQPIESMVITGNMIELWNSLSIAGNDPRSGLSRQIPTIAFENVVFRG